MFQETVAHPHYYVFRRSVYSDLEVYFAFLMHAMSTVKNCEKVAKLNYFMRLNCILTEIGRLLVDFELKHFAILKGFIHDVVYPIIVQIHVLKF
jgi:hypothetical protein